MSKRKYPAVYRIVCQTTGDFYVGSSAYITDRKSLHFQQLRRNRHANAHMQRAWSKYGEESFVFEVLERPPVEKLIEREQHWIDVLEPAYNIRKTAESNLGIKASANTREKMRQAWHNLSLEEQNRAKQILAEGRQKKAELLASGKWQHSPEAIKKIREARARQEISLAMLESLKQGQEIRKQVNPKPRKGMKNTSEHNRKIAKSHEGMKASDETKAKLRTSRLGKTNSEESNRKRSESLKANKRVYTDEQKAQIAAKNRETWAKRTVEEKQAIARKRYTNNTSA